jgi:hypothetical protein
MSAPGTIISLRDRAHRKQRKQDGSSERRSRGESRRAAITALVAVLALLGAGLCFTRIDARDARQAESLPAQTRSELYAHGMEELTTICLQPSAVAGSLREHCLEQARFVVLLPECKSDCRSAVGAVQPHARK